MAQSPAHIPDFDLLRIDARRRKVYDALRAHSMYYQILDQVTYAHLIVVVRRALRLKVIHDPILRESLMEFAGLELTERVGDMLALKLAGAFNQLKKGKPIKPFAGLKEGEWAPVEIAEMRFGRVHNNKLFIDMTTLVMAGTAVGQELCQRLPGKFMATVLAQELGWPKYRIHPTHSELVQLWFTGLLALGDKGQLQIFEFKCMPHQQRYNKSLRAGRNTPCIRDYRQQCRTCPIGYAECHRGTHRYTWIRKDCKRCKTFTIFDPSEPGETVCLLCRAKTARTVWAQERRSLSS